MKISEETLLRIRARSGLDQLSSREKLILVAGLVLVVAFLIMQFIVEPYLDSRHKLVSSIQKGEKDLVEIQLLQKEYGELRQQAGGIKSRLAGRSKDFTLFTFLDSQAAKADVKGQIVYMKPSVVEGIGDFSESLVEIKLQGVDLNNLVQLLKLIESEKNVVSIRRLSIQTNTKEQGQLDAIMQVVTFMEADE